MTSLKLIIRQHLSIIIAGIVVIALSLSFYYVPEAGGSGSYFVRGYIDMNNGSDIPSGQIVTLTNNENSNSITTTTLANGAYQANVGDSGIGCSDGDQIIINCSYEGQVGENATNIDIGATFAWCNLTGDNKLEPDVEYQLIYIYEAEGFLFDVLLELTADSIFESENIEALITLINVGESGLVNATINYTLYNEEEIIWSEEENISILGQLAFNKTIYTTGLNSGDYIFEVVHHYGDGQTASAQATFTVKARSSEGIPLWVIVGFIVAIVTIILFWFFKMREHSIKNREYDKGRVEEETDDIDKIRNKVDKKIAESEKENWQLYR